MSHGVRNWICLLLAICLTAAFASASAAGGHAYATDTPVPAETPSPEPTATPEPAPEATEAPAENPGESGGTETGTGNLGASLGNSLAILAQGANGGEQEGGENPPPAAQAGDAGEPVDLMNPPACEEQVDAAAYVFAAHKRPEAYNPASVLISGILYVSAETEITGASVTVAGGGTHEIAQEDITRMAAGSEPESVKTLGFEPDRERSMFAFLADLSGENLPDGTANVTVTLTMDRVLSQETTVTVRSGLGQYYHVIRALWGQCMPLNEQGEHVTRFQERLKELGSLPEDGVTGTFDEPSLAAAVELLKKYGKSEGKEGFLTSEEVGFIQSPAAEGPVPEAAANAPAGDNAGFPDKVLNFFKGTVPLFGREIPVWILTAAGAALLLILLVVILLIAGKKKKARRREQEASTMNELSRRNAFITSPDEEAGEGSGILAIGDEPTMDLAEADQQEIVYGGDEPTTDMNVPVYTVKFRLIYADRYMDTDVRMQDGGEAVIGRGDGARIQTNPADTSVSHRHGEFAFRGGMLTYTDHSRNGTRYNGQRTLHNGETVNIPFNTKVQFEIGNHKVLVFSIRNNG